MAELQRGTLQRSAGADTAARAVAPARRPLEPRRERADEAGVLDRLLRSGALQRRLTVNPADDAWEREAERTAAEVTTSTGPSAPRRIAGPGDAAPAPALSPLVQPAGASAEDRRRKEEARPRVEERRKEQPRRKEDEPQRAQRFAGGPSGPREVGRGVEADIARMARGGEPLPEAVRARFEPRFGRDLGGVRVHTGLDAAGAAAALDAQAFTVGEHVWFGAGRFQPGTRDGDHLIAHELTHTLQQAPGRAAPRGARALRPAPEPSRVPPRAQRGMLDDAREAVAAKLRQWADELPPYELLTFVIGRDPITDKPVERTARAFVHAVLKLAPDGEAIFQGLEQSKELEKTVDWLQGEVARLDLTWEGVKRLFREAWDAIDALDFLQPSKVWGKIKAVFGPAMGRLGTFALAVGRKLVETIKAKAMAKISEAARKVRGFGLLTFVLGKDPFTDAPVERSARNLVKAVLELVPGGDKIFENLEKAKTIERTVEWLEGEVRKLDLSWEKLKALFRKAWEALSIADLLDPVGLVGKLLDVFLEPARRVAAFALAVGKKVLEFVFEGAMALAGPMGEQIVRIVRKVGDTFDRIVADPIGFVRNLVEAVKLGFSQFSANILEHLKKALFDWLVGALEGAGIQLPEKWDLAGIVSFVLQVLGITYAGIRAKLVKVIGEERVAFIERAFEFVKVLVTKGPVAAWEKIVEAIGSFYDLVIGGIKDWAVTKIVTAAVTKLLTMFNPAGAVIQAVIAIYNTLAFFVERIKQILALVESIVDSIASIVSGKLSAAASYVERTMARTLPVILGFLARLIGLGDVSGAIKKVVTALQAKVDQGIDKLIAWIVEKAKALFGKKEEKPVDAKWAAGVAGVQKELEQLEEGGTDEEAIEKALPSWKEKYGFTSLALEDTSAGWEISGEMSPKKKVQTISIKQIDFEYKTTGAGQARTVHAVPVHRTEYSAPYDDPVGWDRLNHDYWVRGHLLHGRSGGPGASWNLVPIPKKVNSAMWSDHEKDLYAELGKKTKPRMLIWYRAEVTYWGSGGPEKIKDPSHFGKRIEIEYGEAKLKKGKYADGKSLKTAPYDVPLPERRREDLPKELKP